MNLSLNSPGLLDQNVGAGTADASLGAEMSAAQYAQAIELGRSAVRSSPGSTLRLGEMGTANNSSPALLLAWLGGQEIAACVGRGTRLNDAGLARKLAALQRVLAPHADGSEPLAALAAHAALAAMGGFQIAMLVGAALQAAAKRRVIVANRRACRRCPPAGCGAAWVATPAMCSAPLSS